MRRCTIVCLILVLAGAFAVANEQVRRVQEELRKRNVYFGEVDGSKTDETERAIRRYQQRQGFAVTGQADERTLRSLSIALDPVKPDEEWPDGTVVMKSDSAREISEADKRVLEQWNATNPPPALATPSPKPVASEAPATPAPATAEPQPPPLTTPKPAQPKIAEATPVPRAPKLPETARTEIPPRDKPAEPRSRPAPIAKSTPPPPIAEYDPPQRTKPEPKDAGGAVDPKDFVRRYLSACETNQLQEELDFYAPRLSYFDHGNVDRSFVARDVQRYYARWPRRHYELLSCEVSPLPGGEHEVYFKIAFHYENPDKNQKVSGRSVNIFRLRQFDDGPRFISLKEQRQRN